ncbi:MAG: MFS transporter, partial [Chloroflexota bacterium]
VVGIVLVLVQGRYIGKWSKRYGDHRVVQGALALLAVGLILVAFTPRQPPYNYIQARAERTLLVQQAEGDTLAAAIDLPADEDRGLWGVPWLLLAIMPLSIGAGLIRPGLNTMMTKRVSPVEYGIVLGVSSAFVSAANAIAPLAAGALFQNISPTAPFIAGGVLMGILFVVSLFIIRAPTAQPYREIETTA